MATAARNLLDQLEERAATLDYLLEDHPGRHLLAEYETSVLECHALCPAHLADLLARIEQAIVSLATPVITEPNCTCSYHPSCDAV